MLCNQEALEECTVVLGANCGRHFCHVEANSDGEFGVLNVGLRRHGTSVLVANEYFIDRLRRVAVNVAYPVAHVAP